MRSISFIVSHNKVERLLKQTFLYKREWALVQPKHKKKYHIKIYLISADQHTSVNQVNILTIKTKIRHWLILTMKIKPIVYGYIRIEINEKLELFIPYEVQHIIYKFYGYLIDLEIGHKSRAKSLSGKWFESTVGFNKLPSEPIRKNLQLQLSSLQSSQIGLFIVPHLDIQAGVIGEWIFEDNNIICYCEDILSCDNPTHRISLSQYSNMSFTTFLPSNSSS